MSILSLLCATGCRKEAAGPWPQNVTKEDLSYLRDLERDTWRCIDALVAPETGFPHDNNSRLGKTNTTNIGLYLAALCMAYDLGYVTEEQAVARITQILDSLDRCENWHRLYSNLLDPTGKDVQAQPGPSNISDYNKLPAGLIVVRQTFPRLAGRCSAFLEEIPWEVFHQKQTGAMYYEFNVAKKTVDHPVFFNRGEDKILGHFLAIASGKVPADTWDKHNMSEEKKYGYSYYLHGWQGGGLFMQFICGMFLDDRGTKLGHSAATFAWVQMIHALKLGAPVWGWSACVGPDERYHGWGDIQDAIVSPHASVLAISLFPREVIDNLHRLERFGLRKPFVVDGKPEAFGFRDGVNWEKGEVANAYLVLDQAMLFLSLVNFCDDGLLWKTFDRDPLVRRGKQLIREYDESPLHRAEEQAYIASLSYEEPGVCWVPPEWPGRTAKPGQALHRDLWAKSLSSNALNSFTQTWTVADDKKAAVAQGVFVAKLAPRGLKKIGTISVPTDSAALGTKWTISGQLNQGGFTLQTHEETVSFPSYCRLEGFWKLRPGDNMAWSAMGLNESAWTNAAVPAHWEDVALPDYDGMAWYRRTFEIPAATLAAWADKPLALAIGAIDDADETYLNGVKIGHSGVFPPGKVTAFNVQRFYTFDRALLKGPTNVVAVRVSDWGGFGGIWRGPVIIGPAAELQQALGDAN